MNCIISASSSWPPNRLNINVSSCSCSTISGLYSTLVIRVVVTMLGSFLSTASFSTSYSVFLNAIILVSIKGSTGAVALIYLTVSLNFPEGISMSAVLLNIILCKGASPLASSASYTPYKGL